MRWKWRHSPLSFDDYLAVNTQSLRLPIGPTSVQTALLWNLGQGKVRQSRMAILGRLGLMEQLGNVLTPEQRSAPGRAHWPDPEVLAAATGASLREVNLFIREFDSAFDVLENHAGPQKLFLTALRNDPLLAAFKRRLRG